MTAPMIPTVSPNVSSQVVAQQAQPQTSELAKFLLALRQQQDNETRTQIDKMTLDAQIAEAKRRQSALEEAARLAQEQKAAQQAHEQAVAQSTQDFTQRLAMGDRAPTTTPSIDMGLGGYAPPAQIPGQDALQAAIAAGGGNVGEVLQNKGVQDLVKSVTDARAARAAGTKLGPGETLYREGKAPLTNVKAPDLGSEYQAAKQTAGFGQIPDAELTMDQNRAIRAEILARANAGASRQTFNMGNSVAAAAIPKMMEIVKEKADKASDAARDLDTIARLDVLLNEGVKTGFAAPFRTKFGTALVTMGLTDDPTVAQTQEYQAIVGQRVGSIIKQFGSGTGLSDADREYAENIAGGKIAVTDAALRRILATGKRRAKAIIAEGNKAAQSVPEELRSAFLNSDPTEAASAATPKVVTTDGNGNVTLGKQTTKMYEKVPGSGEWYYKFPGQPEAKWGTQ